MSGFTTIQKLKAAKIFLFFAVLLFVAKPFLGFTMFSRVHPPAVENIFVKAFTKRKLEDRESSKFSAEVIQKRLAEAAQLFSLRFSFFLSLFFAAVILSCADITNRFLQQLQINTFVTQPVWLVNGNLII